MSQKDAPWTARADQLGVIASTACFIHCLVTPVILSLLAVYAHLLPSEEHTHRTLAVVVATLGAFALGTGYRRHKKIAILWLMALGLALIFGAAYFGDRLPSHWAEVSITLLGSCCMILAHRKNHTFCKECRLCDSVEQE
jgi:carbon starvation protein CstA